MRAYPAGNNTIAGLYRRRACEFELKSTLQACRRKGLRWLHVVAGGVCSHIGTVSLAVPAAVKNTKAG